MAALLALDGHVANARSLEQQLSSRSGRNPPEVRQRPPPAIERARLTSSLTEDRCVMELMFNRTYDHLRRAGLDL
jgi:hypothetical protein